MKIDKHTYRIRNAAESDIPEIVRVTNAAYKIERFYLEEDRTNKADVRTQMASGVFLVAEYSDEPKRILGTVYISVSAERGYMGPLAVDPDFQGNGIAKALIQTVEEECRQKGSKFLDITVLNCRTDLFPFYSGLGFSPISTEPFLRTLLVLQPIHLIRMTKALYPTHKL